MHIVGRSVARPDAAARFAAASVGYGTVTPKLLTLESVRNRVNACLNCICRSERSEHRCEGDRACFGDGVKGGYRRICSLANCTEKTLRLRAICFG